LGPFLSAWDVAAPSDVDVGTATGLSTFCSISSSGYGIESGDTFCSSYVSTPGITYNFCSSSDTDDMPMPDEFISFWEDCTGDPNNNNNLPATAQIKPEFKEGSSSDEDTEEFSPFHSDLCVTENRDVKGTSEKYDEWTKNKWRFIELACPALQNDPISISPENWTKSNNKKEPEFSSALALRVGLFSSEGEAISQCPRCNNCPNIISVTAKSQELKKGPKIQFQVRLNCLPCYHQTTGFRVVFEIINGDGQCVCSTEITITKVIASRSVQRRKQTGQ